MNRHFVTNSFFVRFLFIGAERKKNNDALSEIRWCSKKKQLRFMIKKVFFNLKKGYMKHKNNIGTWVFFLLKCKCFSMKGNFTNRIKLFLVYNTSLRYSMSDYTIFIYLKK